ncbi:unnamed protein product, partial [Mesorhabditis belari]|uniref:Nucleoside diphosphate kinase-like domain-containing protein n=1 Tax=Mesorhabditis belari TaxID=2138241 RepID=A0AAF3F937_9BILA
MTTFVQKTAPYGFQMTTSLDINLFYYVFMGMVIVFCTNSINIYAGIDELEMSSAPSLLLLKPDVVSHPFLLRIVFDELLSSGLRILSIRPLRLDRSQAENLYQMHRGRFYYGRLVRHISSGPVVALKVIGDARAVLGSSKLFPLAHEKDFSQVEHSLRELYRR